MIAELILQQAENAETERQMRLNNAWKAYEGKLPPQLRPTKSDPLAKDNILLNFGSLIVDKGVSFLMGKEVGFEVDGEADSPEEEWLEACWIQNRKMTLLHKMGINGAVCGDVFVKVQPPGPGQKYPRIINLDPSYVLPIWDMDDFENVLCYRIQWNAIDPLTGRPVVRRQLIEQESATWTITDQISKGNNRNWELISRVVWPYAWSPIFHCQNLPAPNVYWGLSDLEESVVGVNNAINFVISNMARILRIHAHPKVWGRGFNAKELAIGIDETIVLPGQASELKSLEMQSDLSSTLELYKRLKETLHEVTRVPEIATGKVDNIGQLSGLALQILYQSLLEKNDTKQLFYGDMFTELNMRLLEMGKQGEDRTITIQWPDPLPKDAQAEASTAILHDQLGVSKDTLLTKLGYDAQDEMDKKQKERQSETELSQQLMSSFDKGQLGKDEGTEPTNV